MQRLYTMSKKGWSAIVLGMLVASSGYANPVRTMYTVENQFPEQMQIELGANGRHSDYNGDDENFVVDRTEGWLSGYARMGLFDNLAAYAELPYGVIDPKQGNSNSGVGDVVIGFQFLAYEDIFHYPFIIPHLEARLATGDEDKGLGDKNNSVTCGVSVGSKMYDVLTLIVDAEYKFISEVTKNYRFSGSIVWDLDERFALLVEGYVASEERDEWDKIRHPLYGHGGMAYKVTEDLEIMAYGGVGKDGAPSVDANLKAAYTF